AADQRDRERASHAPVAGGRPRVRRNSERTSRRAWLGRVSCTGMSFVKALVEARRIAFVHGSRLKEYLQNTPRNLDEASQRIDDVLAQFTLDDPPRAAS